MDQMDEVCVGEIAELLVGGKRNDDVAWGKKGESKLSPGY